MAFTTLLADNFQGAGSLGSPQQGVSGVTYHAYDPMTGTDNLSAWSRGGSGLDLTYTSGAGAGVDYAVYADFTGPIQTGGLIFELAFYGPLMFLIFDPKAWNASSNFGGRFAISVRNNGDVWSGLWGGASNATWLAPQSNIGAITSSTLTIVQAFRDGYNFIIKVNGTTTFDLSSKGLATSSFMTNVVPTGSAANNIWFGFSDSTDVLTPTTKNGVGPAGPGTVVKYVHVATGTLSGTYLGSPPILINAAVAAVATASSTLTIPPRPPDASTSYPFQNFVAWNELSGHKVSLHEARPHKLSPTATGFRSASALSGDGTKLATYVLGVGDRWMSGGLMDHTPDGWVYLGALPHRACATTDPLGLALDAAGERMLCTSATGWTLYARNAPFSTFFDVQGMALTTTSVACALDSRGLTAAVLTATNVLIYTAKTHTAALVLTATVALSTADTWTGVSLSGDGAQLLVTGATHSSVTTRTGEDWSPSLTPDMVLPLGSINTDGTLATTLLGGTTLRSLGLQNARDLTAPVAPGPSTINGVALTTSVTGLTQASGKFLLALACEQRLPANYALGNGAAMLRDTALVRTFASSGSPRFRPPGQPVQNYPTRSGFWQEPSDEVS